VNSEELSRKLLGLEEPWIIRQIKFDHQEKRVDIFIDFPRVSRFPCPICGQPYSVHDTEEKDVEAPEHIPVPHICACEGAKDRM
jgi:transposase